MKIAIIGTGAMGSLFGAILSSVADVCLIGHFKEHIQAINQNGLIIEKPDGSFKIFHFPVAEAPLSSDTKFDLAIIFTKSYQTETAAHTAKPLLAEKGVALTLQNGLGNADIMADILGKDRVIAGVTSHGCTLIEPGRIRHAGVGPTYIGGSPENTNILHQIAELFSSAGIETNIADNINGLIWGKLLINIGINALTAILRVQNGVLGITPACEKIMEKAVSEAEAVVRALGIDLPYDNPLEQVKKVCEKTAENRASMLQDILRGSRTEIGVINRAIVRKGELLGIPTPYNLFLSEIVEALEATSLKRIRN